MATTFNTVYLGVFPIIDPTEGNELAENASALLGNYNDFQATDVMEMSLVSSASGIRYQQNNNIASDTYTITDSDGNVTTHTFDAGAAYNATVTYIDGTVSNSEILGVIQDEVGNTWLVPPAGQGSVTTLLELKPITGINLTSVFGDTYTGVFVDRYDLENIEVIACFTRGTLIKTDTGEIAIEDLAVGDMIETKNNGMQTLRWIGSTKVAAKGKDAPIKFKAGSVGNHRDLCVSPQHRMLIDNWKAEVVFGDREVFVPAKHMINGDTVFVQEGGDVEYFHMMFDTHEVVFANGSASESFHPGESNMGSFSDEAREEILSLFPQLREDIFLYGESAHYTLLENEARVLIS